MRVQKPEQHAQPELIRFKFSQLDDPDGIEFVDTEVTEGGVRLLRRVASALFDEGLNSKFPGLRIRGGKLEPAGRDLYVLSGAVVEWPWPLLGPDVNGFYEFQFERCTRRAAAEEPKA